MNRITKIFWKRTYLFIEFYSEQSPEVALICKNRKVCMECKQLETNYYRAKLNICIAEGRKLLGSGNWSLSIADSEKVNIDDEVLKNLEVLSNVFRYDKTKAYIVTFHLEDQEDGTLRLSMKTDYMKLNKRPEIRIDKVFLLKKCMNFWYQTVRMLTPQKGNKILFMSENKEEMTGNLKAIYDRMIERGLEKEFVLHKSFRNIFKSGQTPITWLQTVTKIATHDIIFVEDYVPVFGFLNLNQKTTLVQTWHAGFGYKAVGYGRFGLDNSPNPFHSCHRKYSYALVGNENLKEIYSEVFGIEKEALLATGMPRLSNFLNPDVIQQTREHLYEKMPMLKGKRIVTFAPTYRGGNQKEAFYDIDKIDQKRLYEYCENENTVVLFKFHPFLKGQKYVQPEYEELFLDVSEYELNDLFYITDVLVTDYSSCFYDFILLEKPVLFYVYDEEIYSATRGVHRSVTKTAPGEICKTFDELLGALKKTQEAPKEIPDFMIDKCIKKEENTASDKVIDFVVLGKRDLNL